MEDVILTSYKYQSDGDTVLTGYRVVEKMEDSPLFFPTHRRIGRNKKTVA
jgi:hypothetical protein